MLGEDRRKILSACYQVKNKQLLEVKNKQLLDDVFVTSRIIKVEVRVTSGSRRLAEGTDLKKNSVVCFRRIRKEFESSMYNNLESLEPKLYAAWNLPV